MLSFSFSIGGDEVEGRLPFIPTRMRLVEAEREALGVTLTTNAEGEPEVAFDTDVDRLFVCAAAAIGLCWRGDELSVAPLRHFEHNVDAYGDAVSYALIERGYAPADILATGQAVLVRVKDSLPRRREVEEAADPSTAPAARSTETSSSSD